jgi:predicted MFS family arabinose efflux permease
VRRLAAGLFLSFFTAQAAYVVLAPTLTQVADAFDVSVARAGQLRTATAIAGLVAAVAVSTAGRRLSITQLLTGGLALLAAGSAGSAAAPSFAMLALAQVAIGVGSTGVLTAGLAAASEWAPPDRRADVIAWTIVGQPAAWVAALPVIGRLADLGWRWSFVVVPPIALVAWLVVPRGRQTPAAGTAEAKSGDAWRRPEVRRWAIGELMAYAGWGGTLIYAGALLSDSYGLSAETVALLLAAGAVTYFPGAFFARRRLEGDVQLLLGVLAAVLAAGTAVFGSLRTGPALSTIVFGVLVLVAGARGVAGGAFGLNTAPSDKLAIGSIRSGAGQLGYLLGAAGGGLALGLGGYQAVGVVLALFFAAAAAPHLSAVASRRSAPALSLQPAAVPCPG